MRKASCGQLMCFRLTCCSDSVFTSYFYTTVSGVQLHQNTYCSHGLTYAQNSAGRADIKAGISDDCLRHISNKLSINSLQGFHVLLNL